MNTSETNLPSPFFSQIYVEEKAYSYAMTNKILERFNHRSTIIPIKHYKDVFNRSNQNVALQKQSPNLILAVKEGTLVYEGSPVCQNFDNNYFYYTSLMMNCIYDCEYCYLQGMYPSANIVVFVNIDSILQQVKDLLQKHPIYLCISYDTDLLALEPLLGYVHQFHKLVLEQPNLTIELRTKSANYHSIQDLSANDRFILAWTLSPDKVAATYEHRTPPTKTRLSNIQTAIRHGHPVRLCFDPMIYTKNWRTDYETLIEEVTATIPLDKIKDISIGVFRISNDYLKLMRKQRLTSALIQYPYENDQGVAHLPLAKGRAMIEFMKTKLSTYIDSNKLFIWEETANEHQA